MVKFGRIPIILIDAYIFVMLWLTKIILLIVEIGHSDVIMLTFLEQFFLELMKVPRVESKLRVFSFKIQFNTQVGYVYFLMILLFWLTANFVWIVNLVLLCLFIFQVSDLRKNLQIVNSASEEASVLWWYLASFFSCFLGVSTENVMLAHAFSFPDQVFSEVEKGHANNIVFGQRIKPRNCSRWAEIFLASI